MITFPDSPPNGTEIIDRQDDGSVIIWVYNEDLNEWTYQQYGGGDPVRIFTDEILVRDNHQELPAEAFADPSELKTQKDVNYYLNESGGGGGDTSDLEDRVEIIEKALMPWVEFNNEQRICTYNAGSNYVDPSVRMWQDWSVSPTGSWNWAWMVKFPGEDWVDIDDLDDEKAASIGFRGDSTRDGVYVYLYPPEEDDMIDLEVSLKVISTVEGFEPAVDWCESFWPKATWIGKGSSDVDYSVRPKSGRGRLVQRIKE